MPTPNHPLLAERFPPLKNKTCARRHQPFQCGGPHCWCANLQLPPALLATLRQSYPDCLCRDCLQEMKTESYELDPPKPDILMP